MSRTDLRRLLLIATAGLVLRAGLALVTERRPLFPDYYYTDARLNDAAAAELDRARREGRPAAFAGNLSQEVEARLQAALYRVFGPRPLAAKLTYALCGSLAIVAFGLLVAPVLGSGPALAAAAAVAVWPSGVFYTSQNFKEAPTNLLAYAGAACAMLLLTRRARSGTAATLLACGAVAALIATGFYRSYVLLALGASLTCAFSWEWARRRQERTPAALGLAAVLASLLLYLPASRAVIGILGAGSAVADPRLTPQLVPVTYSQRTDRAYYPTSPRALTEFRRLRQSSDRWWAQSQRHREIGTQLFPDARFETWLDVAAFLPKSAFYVLFMPLPGLYPMDGKVGRLLAAAENLVLLAIAALGVAGAVRGPKTPARLSLLAFFAVMTAGSALLEFDLGSAGRHKLLYLPMLFPFAAEEILRLLGRKEPA